LNHPKEGHKIKIKKATVERDSSPSPTTNSKSLLPDALFVMAVTAPCSATGMISLVKGISRPFRNLKTHANGWRNKKKIRNSARGAALKT
jgi:hypothetical protein